MKSPAFAGLFCLYFVRAAEGFGSGQVQLIMQCAVLAHNEQFFRNGHNIEDIKSRYWLNLTNETRFRQAAVVYSRTATMGIDFGTDGMKAML